MKVGLLIIATEVLDGKITDLNTRFLAEFLRWNHLELGMSLTVKDDPEAIKAALKGLIEANDLIITSGGLGPTKDDITKQTLANFLGKSIVYSEEALNCAAGNYKKYERPYPGKEHGYSYLPEGFVPLNNSTGFAPGLFAKHTDKFIFSAPGVPKEFKSMIEDHLLSLISSKLDKDSFIETLSIRTKKVPEEKIFSEVDPDLWDKLSQFGEVSSLPILFGVDIGVKIKAQTRAELENKRDEVYKIIDNSPVIEHVWHRGLESLEEIIISIANKKNIKFGFAESCTGGLCSHRITNVPGSSVSFLGAVVSYAESVKASVLDVAPKTLEVHGAVSIHTASEMAQGLAQKLKVDIAISVTGFAGPLGGTVENPIGTVCIGTCVRGKTHAEKFRFHGDREQLKNRFAQVALMTLLEKMEEFA